MEEVQYLPVANCTGYRVGDDGSLWSCRQRGGKWYLLQPDRRKEDGRARYTIKTDAGTYRRAYASHFVLEAFAGPCPAGMEACHGDGNCINDRRGNLRWDTSIENKADMRKHGTVYCGEKHHKAKVSDADVLEMRRVGYPLKPHSVRYGISESMVSLILRRKNRTNV